jgi:hypothetical protein
LLLILIIGFLAKENDSMKHDEQTERFNDDDEYEQVDQSLLNQPGIVYLNIIIKHLG